ncbi:DUF6587 family protein [Acinetobacter rudis]|uniref:Uncharacterized protein n=1 Tax=Acinetobacter rudis TaxID=632955 RepID=A0AAW8J2D5_9GAMM|nr:DUF6587 family protein [Acinetobacter rudis]MDQ8934167.1 hypothetical protein [Acinetobacter rudis]MDQ8952676.1 hypothetical protein [Acinetobacter rudis]MDQ9016525.1 hypothetical protein [Acinetobacter rudis]
MVEYLIITVLVVWSAIFVFKKVFPKSAYAVQQALFDKFEQLGWHTFAKWLKPKMVAGCGGSCGCDTAADTPKQSKETPQVVKWK